MTTDDHSFFMKCYMVSKILCIHLLECFDYMQKSFKHMKKQILFEMN